MLVWVGCNLDVLRTLGLYFTILSVISVFQICDYIMYKYSRQEKYGHFFVGCMGQ